MKKVLIGLIFAAIFYEGADASREIKDEETTVKKSEDGFIDPTELVINSDFLKNLKLENRDFSKLKKLKIQGVIGDDPLLLNQLAILLSKTKNLEEVDLRYCRLTELPKFIGQLKHLKTLNLEWNDLTSIPESIGNLSKLKVLNLHGNSLKSLPKTIGNLKNLIELDIGVNLCFGRTLPEGIGNLQSIGNLCNLEKLVICANHLNKIPSYIGNLKKLKHLDVSYNAITSIHESIWNLENLVMLDLGYTGLKSLPESVSKLRKLEYLCLYDLELESFPDSLKNLKKLKTLIIGGKITAIPDWVFELSNLKGLGLSYSRLVSIPEKIERLKNLENLSIDYNVLLKQWPSSLKKLKNLKKLMLDIYQQKKWSQPIENLKKVNKNLKIFRPAKCVIQRQFFEDISLKQSN